MEIAHTYSRGASYKDIANHLFIAPTTVRTHLATIYRKLGVSSKVDLFLALEADRAEDAPVTDRPASFTFPDKPSIAVLPFIDMSGNSKQALFADGLTEDLITRLSYLRNLSVIARTSTFSFKNRAIRVQDIAADLGAKFILEGSVRKSHTRVRINAQLVDGKSGAHIWAQMYDRELKDFFTIQDEITREIMIAMQVELTDGQVVKTITEGTKSLSAWEHCLQAILALNKYTKEDLITARRLFEIALKEDPNFQQAKIYLTWTHWIDARYGYTSNRDKKIKATRRLFEEIRGMNKRSTNLHYLEACILLLEHNHDDALSAAHIAASSEPCLLFGYTPAALTMMYCDDIESCLKLSKMTMRLSPYCPSDAIYYLAYALSWQGKHNYAIQAAEDYVRRVPTDAYANVLLAIVSGFAGDEQRTTDAVTKLLEHFPHYNIDEFTAHEPYRDKNKLDTVVNFLRVGGLK